MLPFPAPPWAISWHYDDQHSDLGHSRLRLEAATTSDRRVAIVLDRFEPITARHQRHYVLSHVALAPGRRHRTGPARGASMVSALTWFEGDYEELFGAIDAIDAIDECPDGGWRWQGVQHRYGVVARSAVDVRAEAYMSFTVQAYKGLLPPPGGITLDAGAWRTIGDLAEWAEVAWGRPPEWTAPPAPHVIDLGERLFACRAV